MRFLLFIIFIVVPITEIAVLMEVSDQIGGLTTIALVILTAAVGASLVRSQGVQTLMSAQQKMQQGQQPGQEVIEGILLALAGIMLVTPGFVTDFVGLLLLLPLSRQFFAGKLLERVILKNMAQNGSQQGQPFAGGFTQHGQERDSDIIDGEFVNKDSSFQIDHDKKNND